jgi:hypothetical protein
MLPPFPDWGGLHVLVIHFPVAFLVSTPLLLLLALCLPRLRQPLMLAALIMLAAGSLGVIISSSTGDAAAEIVKRTPEIDAAIEHHEDLAETARTVFLVLTGLLAAIVILPRWFAVFANRRRQSLLLIAALCATLMGDMLLANVAHEGGRLVHVYGIHANMGAAAAAPTSYPSAARTAETDRE